MHVPRNRLPSCGLCVCLVVSGSYAQVSSDATQPEVSIFASMSPDDLKQSAELVLREMDRQMRGEFKETHDKLMQGFNARIAEQDPTRRDDYLRIRDLVTGRQVIADLREHLAASPGVPPAMYKMEAFRAARAQHLGEDQTKAKLLQELKLQEASLQKQMDEFTASRLLKPDLLTLARDLGTLQGRAAVVENNRNLLKEQITKADIEELRRFLWLMEGARLLDQAKAREQSQAAEASLDPWERAVREFMRRCQLDAAQQATAHSVLRELLKERREYEARTRADVEAAKKMTDEQARRKRLWELDQPVRRLRDQLESRLGSIPTASQWERSGLAARRRGATQPSNAQSRPALPASRPGEVAASRPSTG